MLKGYCISENHSIRSGFDLLNLEKSMLRQKY